MYHYADSSQHPVSAWPTPFGTGTGARAIPFAHVGCTRPGAAPSVVAASFVHPGLDPALGGLLSSATGIVKDAVKTVTGAPAAAERAVSSAVSDVVGQARGAVERGVRQALPSPDAGASSVPPMQAPVPIWQTTGFKIGAAVVGGLVLIAVVRGR